MRFLRVGCLGKLCLRHTLLCPQPMRGAHPTVMPLSSLPGPASTHRPPAARQHRSCSRPLVSAEPSAARAPTMLLVCFCFLFFLSIDDTFPCKPRIVWDTRRARQPGGPDRWGQLCGLGYN